jgi:hypothetical protein
MYIILIILHGGAPSLLAWLIWYKLLRGKVKYHFSASDMFPIFIGFIPTLLLIYNYVWSSSRDSGDIGFVIPSALLSGISGGILGKLFAMQLMKTGTGRPVLKFTLTLVGTLVWLLFSVAIYYALESAAQGLR